MCGSQDFSKFAYVPHILVVSKDSNDRHWYLCEINLVHEIEWMNEKKFKRYYNQWIFLGVKIRHMVIQNYKWDQFSCKFISNL